MINLHYKCTERGVRIRLSCALNIKLKTKSVYKIIHDEKTVELNNSRYLPCNPYTTCAILQDPIGSVLQDHIGSGVVRVTTGTSYTHGICTNLKEFSPNFCSLCMSVSLKGYASPSGIHGNCFTTTFTPWKNRSLPSASMMRSVSGFTRRTPSAPA